MAFNPDKCLKFEALADNCTIGLDTSFVDSSHYQFSKDGVSWQPDTITLNSGETCYMKGTNFPSKTSSNTRTFVISAPAKIVSGNLMSLVDDGTGELTEISQIYAFSKLFYSCSNLQSIPSGLLPAMSLANYCYYYLFYGCSGLTSVPVGLLPATTLVQNCYTAMFSGCTGLTSLPSDLLPAITLANNCYSNMFYNCTSLTSLPDNFLPAMTLARECYSNMFKQSGLTSLPKNLLPAKTLTDSCYYQMFENCYGLTSLPAGFLPATNLSNSCYSNMFRNCKNITSVPQGFFAATTLVVNCYAAMFFLCSSLNEIYVPFTKWEPESAFSSWIYKVSETGTFYCPAELPDERGDNRIPVGWEKIDIVEKVPEFNSITFQGNLTAPWNKWKTT